MEVQEANRIRNLINDPAEQGRREQTRKEDAEQCTAFFKIIPEAFIFNYAGTERNLIELGYQPNPAFQPSSREARVLHELKGEMWVDATERSLVSSCSLVQQWLACCPNAALGLARSRPCLGSQSEGLSTTRSSRRESRGSLRAPSCCPYHSGDGVRRAVGGQSSTDFGAYAGSRN